MKRIVTLLLSVLLVVSTLPMMSLSVFASDENIALGKPAIDGGSGAAGYDPAVITDGNLNGMWTSKNDKEFTGPWVGVDLEDQYVITEVILHNAIGFPEAYRRGVDKYYGKGVYAFTCRTGTNEKCWKQETREIDINNP